MSGSFHVLRFTGLGIALALGALSPVRAAGAQETGTPVFHAPYRSFTSHEIGASASFPATVAMRPKLENDVPRFVEESQGQFAGWLGPVYDPMVIDHDPSRADYRVEGLGLRPDLSAQRLADRRGLRQELDARLPAITESLRAHGTNIERAYQLLTGAADQRGVFRLDEEPVAVRERYGFNPHGQSVLQARRLVERGVPLVTVFWPSHGIRNVSLYWDTHPVAISSISRSV